MMTGSSSAAWSGAATTTPATAKQAAKPNNGAAPAPATIGQKVLRGASVAIAITIGATGGTFTALGFLQYTQLTQLTEAAPMPTLVDETRAMWSAVMQLQNDIAVLKSNNESASDVRGHSNTSGQQASISERFDRIERRLDTVANKDATGSVQAPAQPTSPRPGVVAGWSVRDAYGSTAIIQSGRAGTMEVSPGSNIPGLGRVHSVRQQQDGRWVVVTSRGIITSPR
jgi:hypothetical protein